jgi:hypothetical protein
VRKSLERRVALGRGEPAPLVSRANERWSLDFVHDTLHSGRRIRDAKGLRPDVAAADRRCRASGDSRGMPYNTCDFQMEVSSIIARTDLSAAPPLFARTPTARRVPLGHSSTSCAYHRSRCPNGRRTTRTYFNDLQTTALRAFRAVQHYAFGKRGRPRFKRFGALESVEGKSNAAVIRYRHDTLHAVHSAGVVLPMLVNECSATRLRRSRGAFQHDALFAAKTALGGRLRLARPPPANATPC